MKFAVLLLCVFAICADATCQRTTSKVKSLQSRTGVTGALTLLLANKHGSNAPSTIRWSSGLADIAQTHAQECTTDEHSDICNDKTLQIISEKRAGRPSVDTVVKGWNEDVIGNVNMEKVGCGAIRCSKIGEPIYYGYACAFLMKKQEAAPEPAPEPIPAPASGSCADGPSDTGGVVITAMTNNLGVAAGVVTWDAKLSGIALGVAQQCKVVYSTTDCAGQRTDMAMERIAIANAPANIGAMLNDWAGATNCSPLEDCYWWNLFATGARSGNFKIGCAINDCGDVRHCVCVSSPQAPPSAAIAEANVKTTPHSAAWNPLWFGLAGVAAGAALTYGLTKKKKTAITTTGFAYGAV